MTNRNYTIKELSDMYSVTTRTIIRHLESLYFIEKNKTYVPFDIVKLLEVRHKYDTSMTVEKTKEDSIENEIEYDITEGFSNEEYQEFQKRLIEYPMLQKDLEYHRKSAESHQRQMEMILKHLQERNYIEAMDKKLNNGI